MNELKRHNTVESSGSSAKDTGIYIAGIKIENYIKYYEYLKADVKNTEIIRTRVNVKFYYYIISYTNSLNDSVNELISSPIDNLVEQYSHRETHGFFYDGTFLTEKFPFLDPTKPVTIKLVTSLTLKYDTDKTRVIPINDGDVGYIDDIDGLETGTTFQIFPLLDGIDTDGTHFLNQPIMLGEKLENNKQKVYVGRLEIDNTSVEINFDKMIGLVTYDENSDLFSPDRVVEGNIKFNGEWTMNVEGFSPILHLTHETGQDDTYKLLNVRLPLDVQEYLPLLERYRAIDKDTGRTALVKPGYIEEVNRLEIHEELIRELKRSREENYFNNTKILPNLYGFEVSESGRPSFVINRELRVNSNLELVESFGSDEFEIEPMDDGILYSLSQNELNTLELKYEENREKVVSKLDFAEFPTVQALVTVDNWDTVYDDATTTIFGEDIEKNLVHELEFTEDHKLIVKTNSGEDITNLIVQSSDGVIQKNILRNIIPITTNAIVRLFNVDTQLTYGTLESNSGVHVEYYLIYNYESPADTEYEYPEYENIVKTLNLKRGELTMFAKEGDSFREVANLPRGFVNKIGLDTYPNLKIVNDNYDFAPLNVINLSDYEGENVKVEVFENFFSDGINRYALNSRGTLENKFKGNDNVIPSERGLLIPFIQDENDNNNLYYLDGDENTRRYATSYTLPHGTKITPYDLATDNTQHTELKLEVTEVGNTVKLKIKAPSGGFLLYRIDPIHRKPHQVINFIVRPDLENGTLVNNKYSIKANDITNMKDSIIKANIEINKPYMISNVDNVNVNGIIRNNIRSSHAIIRGLTGYMATVRPMDQGKVDGIEQTAYYNLGGTSMGGFVRYNPISLSEDIDITIETKMDQATSYTVMLDVNYADPEARTLLSFEDTVISKSEFNSKDEKSKVIVTKSYFDSVKSKLATDVVLRDKNLILDETNSYYMAIPMRRASREQGRALLRELQFNQTPGTFDAPYFDPMGFGDISGYINTFGITWKTGKRPVWPGDPVTRASIMNGSSTYWSDSYPPGQLVGMVWEVGGSYGSEFVETYHWVNPDFDGYDVNNYYTGQIEHRPQVVDGWEYRKLTFNYKYEFKEDITKSIGRGVYYSDIFNSILKPSNDLMFNGQRVNSFKGVPNEALTMGYFSEYENGYINYYNDKLSKETRSLGFSYQDYLYGNMEVHGDLFKLRPLKLPEPERYYTDLEPFDNKLKLDSLTGLRVKESRKSELTEVKYKGLQRNGLDIDIIDLNETVPPDVILNSSTTFIPDIEEYIDLLNSTKTIREGRLKYLTDMDEMSIHPNSYGMSRDVDTENFVCVPGDYYVLDDPEIIDGIYYYPYYSCSITTIETPAVSNEDIEAIRLVEYISNEGELKYFQITESPNNSYDNFYTLVRKFSGSPMFTRADIQDRGDLIPSGVLNDIRRRSMKDMVRYYLNHPTSSSRGIDSEPATSNVDERVISKKIRTEGYLSVVNSTMSGSELLMNTVRDSVNVEALSNFKIIMERIDLPDDTVLKDSELQLYNTPASQPSSLELIGESKTKQNKDFYTLKNTMSAINRNLYKIKESATNVITSISEGNVASRNKTKIKEHNIENNTDRLKDLASKIMKIDSSEDVDKHYSNTIKVLYESTSGISDLVDLKLSVETERENEIYVISPEDEEGINELIEKLREGKWGVLSVKPSRQRS